jgi:chorismate mutase
MATVVRALRGATTTEADTSEQVTERTNELLAAVLEQNDAHLDDLISVLFTATSDLTSMFPATAARELGFGEVPLLCATEIEVPGSTPRCIRVMLHLHTAKSRSELHHVYLHGAKGLRDDLPD